MRGVDGGFLMELLGQGQVSCAHAGGPMPEPLTHNLPPRTPCRMPEGGATRSSGALPIANMEWGTVPPEAEANFQRPSLLHQATARSEKAGA